MQRRGSNTDSNSVRAPHWEAIDELVHVVVRRGRLAGAELGAELDRAVLAVPEIRQRQDTFNADIARLQVRLGFAHPMRPYA